MSRRRLTSNNNSHYLYLRIEVRVRRGRGIAIGIEIGIERMRIMREINEISCILLRRGKRMN
jgi:hypothetical protein